MEIFTTIIKLLIAFILSLVFGLESQKSHKPIGFGTFVFVTIGSCALGITAISVFPANPTSLLAAIITGIGFLGAGALIKGTDKVFGFMSAASIWLFAIIGLSVGIGEYFISFVMYVLVWVVIIFDKYLEKRGIGSYQKKLFIVTDGLIKEKELKNFLLMYAKNYKKLSVEINKKDNEMHLTYLVEGTSDSINKLVQNLFKEDWLKSCKVE